MALSPQSSSSLQPSTLTSPSFQYFNHPLSIKLDCSNYLLWKTQMENVIYANGFEDYVDGVIQCPIKDLPSGEINSEFQKWRRFDRMILSWIYSIHTPEVMNQTIGFNTSHFVWTALHKLFSASNVARILQLRLEFQIVKKEGTSMIEYLIKVKTIADNLAAAGEAVSHRDHVLQLLTSLGSEYNAGVASLTTKGDDLALASVHSVLLTHEQRLLSQHALPDLHQATVHMTSYIPHTINRRGGSRNVTPSFHNLVLLRLKALIFDHLITASQALYRSPEQSTLYLILCNHRQQTTLACDGQGTSDQVAYIPSSEQLADIFTKHLPSAQFLSLRTKLSVLPPPVSLRGDNDQKVLAELATTVTNQTLCNKPPPVHTK